MWDIVSSNPEISVSTEEKSRKYRRREKNFGERIDEKEKKE